VVLPPAADPPEGDDFDPAAMMRWLADALAAAYRADPSNAALAKELRATLLQLPPEPEEPDFIDILNSEEFRARWPRRVE
jgi:hypothetical protein